MDLDIEHIVAARRAAVEKSIKPISLEELKKLGEQLFPQMDNPWREKYFTFLSEHTDCAYHHAEAGDRYQVVYCRTQERGIWFLPGTGIGPLQARGLAAMKEIVDGGKGT